MVNKDSLLPTDWFGRAGKDINRVKVMLKEGDYEDAGFHLQQAVEKYLKGYLLFKGWKLQKTHDLVDLLNCVVKYDHNFEKFRSLTQITTEYYIEERYPFVITSEITKEEIEENLAKAKELRDKIIAEFEV